MMEFTSAFDKAGWLPKRIHCLRQGAQVVNRLMHRAIASFIRTRVVPYRSNPAVVRAKDIRLKIIADHDRLGLFNSQIRKDILKELFRRLLMPNPAITVNLVEQLAQPDPIQSSSDFSFFGIGSIRCQNKYIAEVKFGQNFAGKGHGFHPRPSDHRAIEFREDPHQGVAPIKEDTSGNAFNLHDVNPIIKAKELGLQILGITLPVFIMYSRY
jgi:hypothetical protein